MLKRVLALTALLALASPALSQLPALAQMNQMKIQPVADAQQQLSGNQTLNQTQGDIAVSLRYLPDGGSTRVFHPNGKGKLHDDFSPYAYEDFLNTQVFQLTIQNNEPRSLGADQLQVQVSLNGLPYEYFDREALIKQWRHYYYLNTNTVTGAPDFMEQERAIAAEKYISSHSFQPQDVPPGGHLSGLIAVPALERGGMLKVRIHNLGNNVADRDFVFHFNVSAMDEMNRDH